MLHTDAQPTPRSEYALHVQGISKAYGPIPALRSIDLCANWGRVLTLFGHNGAGKSTLLRVIATLVKPDKGTLTIGGLDPNVHAASARASIGYVGHQNLLYDDLTPIENLLFYARLYAVPDPAERTAQVLQDVGAEGWANRRVRTLSNGMQKRIAIARALLHRPPILLLDEPDAGLDAEAHSLVDAVTRSVADGGGAVVMTTHDAQRGLTTADDYAVLRSGRIAAQSTAAGTSVEDILTLLSSRGAV